MLVGCYSIHLYCTNAEKEKGEKTCNVGWGYDGPAEYTGETLNQCIKEARKDGWYISRNARGPRITYCPDCAKKRRNRKEVLNVEVGRH